MGSEAQNVSSFCLSSDVHLPIKVKAVRMERGRGSTLFARGADVFLTLQLWADGAALGLPARTRYKPVAAAAWGEWLELPLLIAQAPEHARLRITLHDVGISPIFRFQAHFVERAERYTGPYSDPKPALGAP